MTLSFSKLVGAGNDFVFMNSSDLNKNIDRSQFAKNICDRQFGIGADGLVLMGLTDEKTAHFIWDFYNSDGSKAEMCGNAARCAVRFNHLAFGFEACQFETLAGLVKGKLEGPLTRVEWNLANNRLESVELELSNKKVVSGFFINTGVPHFVITNSKQVLSNDDCLLIQSHSHFGKAQTNVTLLETKPDGLNLTKTFERGVRDFTLACGTGVIASAFVLQQLKALESYQLRAPGGELQVQLDGSRVQLIGPAQLVFNGTLEID